MTAVFCIFGLDKQVFFFFFLDVAACRPRKQMAAGHYLPFFLLVFLLFTRLFLCENEKNPERGSRVETRKFRNQNIKIALPLMSNRFSEIETLFGWLFWRNRWSRSDDSAANGFFFFLFLFGWKKRNDDSVIRRLCREWSKMVEWVDRLHYIIHL